MCTMDYVTHVLGLQGWQRCKSINDYMAGWEDLSECLDDEKDISVSLIREKTKNNSCQTDPF